VAGGGAAALRSPLRRPNCTTGGGVCISAKAESRAFQRQALSNTQAGLRGLALIDALTASPKGTSVAYNGLIAYAAMLEPGIGERERELWMVVAPEATASTLLELRFVYVASERARELPRLQDLACEIALRLFASLSVR